MSASPWIQVTLSAASGRPGGEKIGALLTGFRVQAQ